ncbi:cytochrome p450 [Moniliophthora roreri]|nr:cytochrome p450 [Moniliophthora roreri]
MDYLLSLLAGLGLVYLLSRWKRGIMPPGPPKRPIIGILMDMPTDHDWKEFARWGDTYGPLVSISVFGTNVIIINTYKKAIEMLDKKSPIYSGRPYIVMTADLMGWGKSMGLLPYGSRFRQTRKIFHQELGSNSAIRSFFPQEESQARNFLRLCVAQPEKLLDHCFQCVALRFKRINTPLTIMHRHAGAIVLRVAYGYKAKDNNDPIVIAANEAMETLSKSLAPGAFLVNQIPILRFLPEWFPGAGFKKTARLWAPLYDAMVDIPFNFVVKQLTAVALYMFFLMMCLHPDVQRRAQAEIDEVVGRDRLPTFEDKDKMPYLEALTKEILRQHVPVPTGLPHSTTEDDIHDGWYIPKGSLVLANIWKMSRDPSVYQDPETFDPGRFLGSNYEQDPRDYVYGFAFDIAPMEVDGKVVFPEFKTKTGTVSHIEKFNCRITPRFSDQKLSELLHS